VSRDVLCKTPPGTISGLTGFPGDSSDSGRNPGLEREADLGILRGRPRTNRGKSRTPLPFSRSGLIMGVFFRDCEESAADGNRFLVTTHLPSNENLIQAANQPIRSAMNAQMSSYFSRQTAVPEIGQAGLESLQSAKVAVVGAGGVGSAAAYFLASQGIGFLKLIDQDVVEETNLHRLVGVDYQDLHLPKAEALSRRLRSHHQWTRTEAITETLRTENATELLGGVDLIVDGTDNFQARYALNRFATENHVPYLFTSAIANQGHLSLFSPPATPCLECMISDAKSGSVESCETVGVTAPIVGLIGTLAASEATKRLLALPTAILGQLLTVDLAGPDFLFTKIAKRDACAVCSGSPFETIHQDNAVMLCGESVANVLPEQDLMINLQSLNTKIPKESVVACSESVFVYNRNLHRVSVFKTGRLLIQNVRTEDAARQVASEVWNEIL